jgi:hypothetical protein
MQLIPAADFLAWAGTLGIGLDERFDEPRCLAYRPYRDSDRFWALPEHPETWPFFVAQLLAALEPWLVCALWVRSGLWPDMAEGATRNGRVRSVILRGAGIPSRFVGGAKLGRGEEAELLAVAFAQLAFGSCVMDDLFIVPDHGRYFLQTDHHDAVHVSFADENLIKPFVDYMEEKGFPLPCLGV